MKIDIRDGDDGVTHVVIDGRLDIEGVNAIDMKMNVVAGSKNKVVVDLAGVDFMGSLGMRTLVVAAKTVANKGGKLVLLQPQPNVDRALRTSGIDTVIPIAADSVSAAALVS